jgi:hypothetical protein
MKTSYYLLPKLEYVVLEGMTLGRIELICLEGKDISFGYIQTPLELPVPLDLEALRNEDSVLEELHIHSLLANRIFPPLVRE